jgi:hypothetical protein
MKTKYSLIFVLILSACSLTGTGPLPKVKTRDQTYVPSVAPTMPVEASTTASGPNEAQTPMLASEGTTAAPEPSFFIFGDSTADHAVETIARLGLPYKSKAFISYQCPFLSSDWLSFGGQSFRDLVIPNTCSDWSTKGIRQLSEWNPDIVILWQMSDQFNISCKKGIECSLHNERSEFENNVGVPVVFVHWPNWTNPNEQEIAISDASLNECNTHKYCFDAQPIVESLLRPDRIHLATPTWGNTDSIGTLIVALITWIKENVK